jgi:N-acetylmuramoyl-L-alanine amidase
MKPALTAALAAVFATTACAPPPPAPPAPVADLDPLAGTLPPVPHVSGPLALDIVYPAEDATLTASDSTFVFGSVGTGDATLRINGHAVRVAPNGAFLAFLPVPADGSYRVEASAGAGTASLVRQVRVPAAAGVAPELGDVVVQGSILPAGAFAGLAGEPFEVRFRGAPGTRARLRLPDGTVVPFAPRPVRDRVDGFMQDGAAPPREFTEYVAAFELGTGWVPADTAVPRPRLAQAAAGQAVIEVVQNGDTVLHPVPVSVAVLDRSIERTGIAAADRPDRSAVGTAVPGPGTPYYWLFPNGTRFRITGERGGLYRVQLTSDLSVWIPVDHIRLEPAPAAPVRGTVGSIRVAPQADHVDVRLATSARLPFRVTPSDDGVTIEVYGAETRTNWLYHGAEDALVEHVEWRPVSDERYRVDVRLRQPLWGYSAFWTEAGHLVVRLRRPPAIDRRRPLQGLLVAVDAGHPPGGAIGPTRLTEAEANLAIARRLRPMLEAAGARVLEIRPDTAAVALGLRPQMAIDSGAHVLLSIHNNAYPDGVNPFANAGTSMLYTQAHAVDLARHLQREMVAELRLRDSGIIWGDLAMTRGTWMPAVLSETMFLMVPEQEAALRDPRVHERIARAHFRALESFLRERAP